MQKLAINETVILNFEFPHIPKREDKVKLVFWYSSNDEKSYKTLLYI